MTRWVTDGAKKAGAWRGRYTTLREFEAWHRANPEFVASHFKRPSVRNLERVNREPHVVNAEPRVDLDVPQTRRRQMRKWL